MNQELIDFIRKNTPEKLAKELVDVQPMPADAFIKMMESGKSESWLIENGYEPVHPQTRLLWQKKSA